MKKVFYSVLAVCAFSVMACQKENAETPALSNEEKTGVAPLTFGSVSEIRNVLYSMQGAGSDGISTKSISSNPDFLSYAETVMLEPGYDDKPNAIISEVFGSVLNPDGEVIFGDYMLKVCDYGILYTKVSNANTVRSLVSLNYDMGGAMPAANCPIPLNDPEKIYVTGNTAIDALKTTVKKEYDSPVLQWAGDGRIILLTAHRRENWGAPLKRIFTAVNRITEQYPDVRVIYPCHMNPAVRGLADEMFRENNQVRVIEPLEVTDFHNLIKKSYLVLTDSGGIQEEGPSLGKPVLVVRETTERPEGVEAGTLKLVGTSTDNIVKQVSRLLDDEVEYERMSKAENPYGDGHASERIVDAILRYFRNRVPEEISA